MPQPLPEIGARRATVYWAAKRSLDIVGVLVILPIAFPVWIVFTIAIVIIDRHPPFYADNRVTTHGRSFKCIKLRSMRSDDRALLEYLHDHPDEASMYTSVRKLNSDPRITKLGTLIRKYSIDETPQLINVLIGDMSLVGPRPLSPAESAQRYSIGLPVTNVRPGLTGLWQISGRSDLPEHARFELDHWYANNWTPLLDIVILIRTPLVVISGRGAR